ncbi:unnamed protein product [Symbiodinium sp. CCMP2592]|nr:unnamed protein product [Symbiodinium sp. CCMP2592]
MEEDADAVSLAASSAATSVMEVVDGKVEEPESPGPCLVVAPAQQSMAGDTSDSESDGEAPLQRPATGDDNEDDEACVQKTWHRGVNCGSWVGTLGSACLQAQSQVLVANVVANVQACEKKTMKHVLSQIRPGCSVSGQKVSFPIFAASRFLGLGAYTVRNVWEKLQRSQWQPQSSYGGRQPRRASSTEEVPATGGDPSENVEDDHVPEKVRAMENVCLLAISCAVEGQSGWAYERQAARWKEAGVHIGPALHSRRFFREVTHVASLVLSQLEGLQWSVPVLSTGCPSDFALMLDPVSLGSGFSAKHETVLMVTMMLVNSTGNLMVPMCASPTLGIGDHRGDKLVDLTLKCLEDHPGVFDRETLRARLSLVAGDGGIVAGGKQHRHKSTGAAEKLWKRIHGDSESAMDCVDWDAFHRDDISFSRAVARTQAAAELFALAKDLDHLFNYGDGRIIFRSLQKELDVASGQVRQTGGTRKVGALSLVPESILQHLKRITVGLRLRYEWRKEGHGNFTLDRLTQISRRLLDPAFLTFTMLMSDVTRGPVRHHALLVQGALEPWACKRADSAYVDELSACLRGYEWLETCVQVTTLLAQHCSLAERACFLVAWSSEKKHRMYTGTFLKFAAKILLQIPPSVADVELAVELPEQYTKGRAAGPHCQCPGELLSLKSRGKVPSVRLCNWTVHEKRKCGRKCSKLCGKVLRVPFWVAQSSNTKDGALTENVPTAMYHYVLKVLDGIRLARGFVERLQNEFQEIIGTVGVNDEMMLLVEKMQSCFAWQRLVTSPPSQTDCESFLTVWQLLEPFLAKCLWPDPQAYPLRSLSWDLAVKEKDRQYRLFCKRVRLIAAASQGTEISSAVPEDVAAEAAGWWETSTYVVRPVWVLGWVKMFLLNMLPPNTIRKIQWDITDRVSRFLLGDMLPAAAWSRHEVPVPEVLEAFKYGRRKRKKTMTRSSGGLRSWKGKVVRIVDMLRRIRPERVSATIDSHPCLICTSLLVSCLKTVPPLLELLRGMPSDFTTDAASSVGQKPRASAWGHLPTSNGGLLLSAKMSPLHLRPDGMTESGHDAELFNILQVNGLEVGDDKLKLWQCLRAFSDSGTDNRLHRHCVYMDTDAGKKWQQERDWDIKGD